MKNLATLALSCILLIVGAAPRATAQDEAEAKEACAAIEAQRKEVDRELKPLRSSERKLVSAFKKIGKYSARILSKANEIRQSLKTARDRLERVRNRPATSGEEARNRRAEIDNYERREQKLLDQLDVLAKDCEPLQTTIIELQDKIVELQDKRRALLGRAYDLDFQVHRLMSSLLFETNDDLAAELEGEAIDALDLGRIFHDNGVTLGRKLHRTIVEAGQRWMLDDKSKRLVYLLAREGSFKVYGRKPGDKPPSFVKSQAYKTAKTAKTVEGDLEKLAKIDKQVEGLLETIDGIIAQSKSRN